MGKHDMILSPLVITDKLRVKNRFVKSPQSTWFWEEDGSTGERAIAFYESIAKGGAGMIVLSAVLWTPLAGLYCSLAEDRFMEGVRRLVDAVHKHDCRIICQLHHPGPSAAKEPDGGLPKGPTAMSADEIPVPRPLGQPTRELTLEDIAEHKRRYVAAAVRAKACGFDGLEFHAAHGYFFESFVSRVWNHRTDQYGAQNWENRTRLVREVFAELRAELGADFPIGARFNGQEWGAPGAFSMEEAVEFAKILEKASADYLSISGYGYGPMPFRYLTDYFPYPEPEDHMKPYMDRYFGQGMLVPPAEAVKKAVKVPVIVAGRLNEDIGEAVLREGKADLIALGRGLWADPELPNKVKEGRFEDIVRCNRCASCENPVTSPRKCRVNPALGFEREYAILPATKKKKVMVVGAGPAGMEAARVAHLRGHDVTLYDREGSLGGRLSLAAMIKGTEIENCLPLRDYLITQVRKLGIRVRLNTEVTRELIAREKPDAVLVACGGAYVYPDVPGINGANVVGVKSLSGKVRLPMKLFGPELLNRLTKIFLPVGKNVVILGGQIEGLQGAVFLRKRGRNVTVLESSDSIGAGIPEKYFIRLPWWFKKRGVDVRTGVRYDEITRDGVRITGQDGRSEFIKCDTVMVLTPQRPNTAFADAIRDLAPEVHVLGSVRGSEAGLMIDALKDGRRIGVAV